MCIDFLLALEHATNDISFIFIAYVLFFNNILFIFQLNSSYDKKCDTFYNFVLLFYIYNMTKFLNKYK